MSSSGEARTARRFCTVGIVLVATVFSVPTWVAAFEGRLVTEDGRPLVGAHVQVLGGRGSVMVDSSGSFVLEPDPAPPFELLVTRADGVVMQPILVESLPAEGVLELRLTAAVMTGSVTVLGAVPDLELPPAAAFTVAGGADLALRLPDQLGNVLETLPGTETLGSGPAAVPSLRGLAASRTLILLDEGRVTAERRAGPSATFLDPSTVDEVEVIRGPGSVAYGSDAFGGLIRARTRIPGPGDEPYLRYSLLGGWGAPQLAANVEYGGSAGGGGFMVGASYRDLDNYSSPQGEVLDSGSEGNGFRLGYQTDVGGGLLRALWRTDLGRDIGKPALNSAERSRTYPEEDSHRMSLSFERPGPGNWSRLAASASWVEYHLLTSDDRMGTPERARTVTEADVLSHDYGLRLEAERPLGPARLILGLDANGRYGLHATNRSDEYDLDGNFVSSELSVEVGSARRDDLGVFAGVSSTVGRVALSGGLRGDRVSTDNSGGYFGERSTSASDWSGFAAASFSLRRDLELSAQVARGFRDALLSDRYYRGLTGRGSITGNPDLEPETSLQYDLALRYSPSPVRLAAYAYHYRIDELIERYESTADEFLFRNRGQAEIRGYEIEGAMELGADITTQVALQRVRGEAVDDDATLDSIPADGVIVTVRRDPSLHWWWMGRVAVFDRDERPGPTEDPVPGHTVADVAVGFRVSPALELQVLGRNLFDRAYPASSDGDSVLAAGRSVTVSVRGRVS